MSQNTERHRLDVAMFRYRVIAPLIDLAGSARMAEVRRLAGKAWVIEALRPVLNVHFLHEICWYPKQQDYCPLPGPT